MAEQSKSVRPEPDLHNTGDKYKCDSCGKTHTGAGLVRIEVKSGYYDESGSPIMETVDGSPCCHDTVTSL